MSYVDVHYPVYGTLGAYLASESGCQLRPFLHFDAPLCPSEVSLAESEAKCSELDKALEAVLFFPHKYAEISASWIRKNAEMCASVFCLHIFVDIYAKYNMTCMLKRENCPI